MSRIKGMCKTLFHGNIGETFNQWRFLYMSTRAREHLKKLKDVYNKENLERQETNK